MKRYIKAYDSYITSVKESDTVHLDSINDLDTEEVENLKDEDSEEGGLDSPIVVPSSEPSNETHH